MAAGLCVAPRYVPGHGRGGLVLATFSALQQRVGQELGVSDWHDISQSRIDAFGATTSDPDPMHMDPTWASRNSPFKSTIAFGFLTISMLTALYHDVMKYDRIKVPAIGYGLNYGFNRLRLIAPVPVGSKIRGRFSLNSIDERLDKKFLLTLDVVIEIEGQEQPALVAEWLVMWVEK